MTWSYQHGGATRSGELSLKGDGTVETLNNIPDGTVVTLTEKVPSVAGVGFGDPAFSGEGVTDDTPDANSAQVTVAGLKTLDVTLTNPVGAPASDRAVSDHAVLGAVGVCPPGGTEPTEPSVRVTPTDGVVYSEPRISSNGNRATIQVTATAEAGRTIDEQNLPDGWAAAGDGSFVFTRTVAIPTCGKAVKPGLPRTGT